MSDLPESVESAAAKADAMNEETSVEQNENAPGDLQEQMVENSDAVMDSIPAVIEAQIKPQGESEPTVIDPAAAAAAEPNTTTAEHASTETVSTLPSGDPAQLDPSLSALVEQDGKSEVAPDALQQSLTALAALPEDEHENLNEAAERKARGRSESIAESMKSGGSSSSGLPDNVPRVGGVRCYWAFLKPRYPDQSDPKSKFELEFIHLDPVLSAHMRSQSLSMLGRGVIEFIHPEEREREVRFARLSRIRTILGCPPEEDDIPADAHKFVEDGEYLALDLSIHWACTGLILAFFHAIRDKDVKQNNDISKRHEEWSNYCGTAAISEEDIESMWKDVSENIPFHPPNEPAPPPERVFIVHTTEESAVRPNSVVFAWPPPRIKFGDEHGESREAQNANEVATSGMHSFSPRLDENGREIPRMDGSYWADDYAELMKHVELENKTGKEDAWGTFGKTSCTSRFQGGHLMTNEGLWRKIESIFIPYGNITFASYQTTQALPLNAASDLNVPTALLPTDVQVGVDPNQQYYDVLDPSNATWQPQVPGQVGHLDGHVQSYPPEWEQDVQNPANLPPLTGNSMQFYQHNGYQHDYPQVPGQTFPLHSLTQAADMQYHGTSSIPWNDTTASQTSQRGTKRKQNDTSNSDKFIVPYQSATDRMSIAPRMVSGSDLPEGTTSVPAGRGRKITTVKKGEDGQTIVKVTVAVPPPEGVECCVQCGNRESPEWRKSESGVKNLCNACGLKLARLQAKREGRQKPRKKKPPANAQAGYNPSGPSSAGSSSLPLQGQPMQGMMPPPQNHFPGDPNMTLNSLNSWQP
ncbi:hypothetical protein QFC22_004446 [Naganishia vaughanmartiniae]|uniref:Uncharacterized protein n=1 Tax=Naganishia vaughanmartiniae TaxID=1424756 RepID=A0ACC2X3H3_9TREE|nr:hypothetical protein QFC22_004446 [Naganishia vaughanmartiniae]